MLHKVLIVFNQTEYVISSKTEVSPKHGSPTPDGYFENTDKIFRLTCIIPRHYAALKFVDDDDFSFAKIDTVCETVHVNQSHADHISSHTTTHPGQRLSTKMKKVFHNFDDPTRSNPLISHPPFAYSIREQNCRNILSSINGSLILEKRNDYEN